MIVLTDFERHSTKPTLIHDNSQQTTNRKELNRDKEKLQIKQNYK